MSRLFAFSRTQRLCANKSGVANLENSSTVWSWEIHVFTNLYPSVESSPRMKKTQRRWPESFQSQEQIDERTWHRITDWLGLETMVWMQGISIDPYQGRSQAENQCVPIIGFRPVRDRLSPRSFIKRQLRPDFLRSQASTHGPKRGFGKNTALLLLVVSFT